jgi:HAD superfamily hydrolase (TIGR01450 family)
MRSSERLDPGWACRRYEEIRLRLPQAKFPETSQRIANLGDLVDQIDVFVLDGFGVLNIGASGVPGAPERIRALRASGKQVIVLTNGASRPVKAAVQKYESLGFDFTEAEVVSSRDALARAMAGCQEMRWGFSAIADSAIEEIASRAVWLRDDPADYRSVDGFALLSTGDWNQSRQDMLLDALKARPRPLLVGNPDLVAPREDGLSVEPGLHAHDIADAIGIVPEFYGKPFANAFEIVSERIGPGVPPRRIAMVGDTLHTDILGGASMGWRSVLVMNHGLLKGFDVAELGDLSDIRPDFIADTT